MVYEELLDEAAASNIKIIENADFKSRSDGLIYGDVIALNKNLQTNTERACILAEELGHYYTSTGDIIDQGCVSNRKQERKARLWAYCKMITFDKLIEAFEYGCRNTYEVAEYLGVTENFLKDSLQYISEKYGNIFTYEDYIFNLETGYISKYL